MPSNPTDRIPFNIPPLAHRELEYLARVIEKREFAGNGEFSGQCHRWLRDKFAAPEVLITHSCTAALEMAAILAGLEPGDEVIMPSFTFVSTANAVVLRGAVPVFVDIRADTQNIDEKLIESAITDRTKAICAVHYAGVCAEMDAIRAIADRFKLVVIEDAAQAFLSTYRGKLAGTLSDLACFSFHETKNITSGEGGALLVNRPDFSERAFIIWEKGTNRRAFKQGRIDKYSWVDIGSSFLPSEFTAAVLCAQLEEAERFCSERIRVWERYHAAFADFAAKGSFQRPTVPSHCSHNGHLYYLILRTREERDHLIQRLASDQIGTVFHYVPLHSSPAGIRYGRSQGSLPVTNKTSDCIVRLPLHAEMTLAQADRVIERVHAHVGR